ncbi:hypothetical protein H0E87_027927, partial [Populus deltoides]
AALPLQAGDHHLPSSGFRSPTLTRAALLGSPPSSFSLQPFHRRDAEVSPPQHRWKPLLASLLTKGGVDDLPDPAGIRPRESP